MTDQHLKQIVNNLAKKHNLPITRVEHAIEMQFSFIRSMIAKGELKSVQLMHLGKIFVKPHRRELLLKYNELKRKQIEAGEDPTGLAEFAMAQRRNRELSKAASLDMQRLPKEQK